MRDKVMALAWIASLALSAFIAGAVIGREYAPVPVRPIIIEYNDLLSPTPPSKIGPRKSSETRTAIFRAELARIAKDYNINGTLDCRAIKVQP